MGATSKTTEEYTIEQVEAAVYAYYTDIQAAADRISPQELIDSLEGSGFDHALYTHGKSVLAEADIVMTSASNAPPETHLALDIGTEHSPRVVYPAGYRVTVPLRVAIALRRREQQQEGELLHG